MKRENRNALKKLVAKLNGDRIFTITTAAGAPSFLLVGESYKRDWSSASQKEDAEKLFLFMMSLLPWKTLESSVLMLSQGEEERLCIYKNLLKKYKLNDGEDA